MFESDGLFSYSDVLSSSFVRIKRCYCSIVSDFFTKMRRGRARGLLSIPR